MTEAEFRRALKKAAALAEFLERQPRRVRKMSKQDEAQVRPFRRRMLQWPDRIWY